MGRMTPSHKVVVKTSRNNAGEELQTMPSPGEPHKASGHLSQEPVSAPCSVWAESPFTPRCCLHTHVSPTTRQCTSKAPGDGHLAALLPLSAPTSCPSLSPTPQQIPCYSSSSLFRAFAYPVPTAQVFFQMSTGLTALVPQSSKRARSGPGVAGPVWHIPQQGDYLHFCPDFLPLDLLTTNK